MRTRTHFCFENRPPTWESRRRWEFFEMQGRDVVLRLSDHVILWISLFRERTPSRHVSGKSPVSDGKALSPYLFHHFSLRVFLRFKTRVCHTLRWDFLRTCCKEYAVGSSGSDGLTYKFPGMLHKLRVSGCGLESRQSPPSELGTTKG